MSTTYETGYDYEPAQTSGPYLNLKEKGDKVRFRIASYPIRWEDSYQGKPNVRFAWAVIHKWADKDGTKHKEAKAFRAGSLVYGAIRTLLNDPDWGDPTLYDIEVERTENKNAYYSVTPKPNGKPLTDEEKALFAEHGYAEGKPDWANAWLEKLYLSKKDGTTSGGAKEDEFDPFADE